MHMVRGVFSSYAFIERKRKIMYMKNGMPDSIILILGLLIWITSKIIYIFLEIIIIENVLYKRNEIRGLKFWDLLKASYKLNKAEINATIFHTVLNAFSFISTLVICMHYFNPEACEFVGNHVGFLLLFDFAITMTILIVLNYLLKYKIAYKLVCKPIMDDVSIDPSLLGEQDI